MVRKISDTGIKPTTIIFGAGLAGLSAGFALVRAGQKVVMLESSSVVGGLARTVVRDEFRFDLGGHRFWTNNSRVEQFVRELMEGELLTVQRQSKIYLRDRYFDYPLKAGNAILGLGIPSTLKMIAGFSLQRLRGSLKKVSHLSLEDWVVSHFGRPMFNLYFKEYSEKVWGMKCDGISAEWVRERIKGLSLSTAIKNALFKSNGNGIPTLTDKFLYPALGIGRIAEKLRERIDNDGPSSILTNTGVKQVNHSDFRIKSIVAENCRQTFTGKGSRYISSIPMTALVQMLHPAAPDDVLEAAANLRYRDIVIVTLAINRKRITDQTWIYFPDQKIPFSRIHEPTNWSREMAPQGKTLLVAEYFCSKGDQTWRTSDEDLSELTIQNLGGLDLIKKDEVIDSLITRIPYAYPVLEVGYRKHYDKIRSYLGRFKNLHLIGRCGMFAYHNIDHVIESGLLAAEDIINR